MTKNSKEGYKTVCLFKDNGRYRDDVFVAVNGRGFTVRRGEPVQVPPEVEEVLTNGQNQDLYAMRVMEENAGRWQEAQQA